MAQTDVLIVGAGPTGLVLALWLTKQGVKVRIIDKSSGPGETSRAMAVQARTLELYRQLDLADDVVSAGYKPPAMNWWARGKRRAHVQLADAGKDLSPYPFVLVFPQDKHERLLVERLACLGVNVERQTELISFESKDDSVAAALRHQDGQDEHFTARYLAGCDGAHSLVRHEIGAGFEGGTYKQLFYVADVSARGIDPAGDAHVVLDKSDFALVMPYGEANRYRLIGTIGNEPGNGERELHFADAGHEALHELNAKIDTVNWFSTYRIHHRVTDRFRQGRVFLLGDAAHVHSPAGGQGMNTGILDAVNLAWKLTAVVNGQADDDILDSYAIERQGFARKLVQTTDKIFTMATAEGGFAEFIRTKIAPTFISLAYRSQTLREYLFRMVSQTTLSYGDSPLSSGQAGKVRGGDRLPWVPVTQADNYAPLKDITWQVHVYGKAAPDLQDWCTQHRIPLHVFAWQTAHEKAGLEKHAAYLLRPDTYVDCADAQGNSLQLEEYAAARGLTFG